MREKLLCNGIVVLPESLVHIMVGMLPRCKRGRTTLVSERRIGKEEAKEE